MCPSQESPNIEHLPIIKLADRHSQRSFRANIIRHLGLTYGKALHLRGLQRMQLDIAIASLRLQTLRDVALGLQRAKARAALAPQAAESAAKPSPQLPDLAPHGLALAGLGKTLSVILARPWIAPS